MNILWICHRSTQVLISPQIKLQTRIWIMSLHSRCHQCLEFVNPESTFISPGPFSDSTASKTTWFLLPGISGKTFYDLYSISPRWTKRGKHDAGGVSVFVLKSKMVWVGWSLMIPSRRKAKCVLKSGTGLALHAWTYRQLHNRVWNNGEEIKKQSARKSFPFLPSVWAERP